MDARQQGGELMAKNPHPSGRPIRRDRKVGRGFWNYPNDPNIVYAIPRLRQKPPAAFVADAIGYLHAPVHHDEDHAPMRIGFIDFGES